MLQVWKEGYFKSGCKSKKARKGHRKIEGHEKIKACKSPCIEHRSTSGTMDTVAMCSSLLANSILQYISSEWNSWSSIPPYEESTGQQSQQTGTQLAYPAIVIVNTTQWTGTPVWLWGWPRSIVQYNASVHLQVTVLRQETRASHSSHQWIWWPPSKNWRVIHSCTSHWKSGSTESSVPGHRYKTIHHPWPWNSITNRLHTLPKNNSTKGHTTIQDTYSHEDHNGKGIKTQGDKQDGSRYETPKCPSIWWCSTINWKKHNLTITKEYILKEYYDVVPGIGMLSENEYHIKQKKDYKPVQYPPRSVLVNLKLDYKKRSSSYVVKVSSHQCQSTLNGPIL